MARREKVEEAPASTAARNLGPEIELLRSFNIPASRIAFLLDESHANIRQISRRSQFPQESSISVAALPTREQQIEEFLLYGQKRHAVESLEWQVEDTFNQHASRYQFAEGAKALGLFISLSQCAKKSQEDQAQSADSSSHCVAFDTAGQMQERPRLRTICHVAFPTGIHGFLGCA